MVRGALVVVVVVVVVVVWHAQRLSTRRVCAQLEETLVIRLYEQDMFGRSTAVGQAAAPGPAPLARVPAGPRCVERPARAWCRRRCWR